MFGLSRSQHALFRQVKGLRQELKDVGGSELQDLTKQLRYRFMSGEKPSALIPTAFALVQEAAERTLGYSHFDCQLQAGFHLVQQRIIEMETGQGKTLTATLPLFVFALAGRGCHLATSNDYLARRDAETMGPLFSMLGMTVGVIQEQQTDDERRENYSCDITYGTAAQFGFDYLRDRVKSADAARGGLAANPVQREFHCILADEADALMIDEADTPLILSNAKSAATNEPALYYWAATASQTIESTTHYKFDHRTKKAELTDPGRKWVRQSIVDQEVDCKSLLRAYELLELAIMIKETLHKNQHYILRDDSIVLVNAATGRLGENQEWQDGIQQLIQAKEGLPISVPNSHAAKLTVQALFLAYPNLAGMTGSASAASDEFRKVYGKQVVRIAPKQQSQKRKLPTQSFRTKHEKLQAICKEIQSCRDSGKPVLVGTRSVEKSETLARLLKENGIDATVLNAKYHEREAAIIAMAGQAEQVTVATEMAGRGTDIKPDARALQLGGLHVILTEHNLSPRQDQQLIGRCGRQGQPGSFRFMLSLEDDILAEAYGEAKAERLQQSAVGTTAQLLHSAQQVVEKRRKQNRLSNLYHEKKRLRSLVDMGQDPVLDTV